jgi:maltooligosyltrehalose trehalohydrolase
VDLHLRTTGTAAPSTHTRQNNTVSASRLGAHRRGEVVEFLVWGPSVAQLDVHLIDSGEYVRLELTTNGYHAGYAQAVAESARYLYRIDGRVERPDPASRWQPDGVHKPSAVLPQDFRWADKGWRGIELADYIFYEVHVGTYTPEGTFAALIDRLPELRELGVTAIEIMPVAEFPGERNWGYDGACPFAAHHAYGGPLGLKKFVNACHGLGLAVVLDVVYNHLGPEGNYLADFGPYFTDRYHTPWGDAINFDGPYSDHVVRYFVENALQWLDEFHIDALRLDAIHGIVDQSAQPFLACLSKAVDELAQAQTRNIHLIAESDLNDFRVVQSRELGGYGLHAQWSDDFHHALHSLQTGERDGYYEDFGRVADLAKAFRTGFVYEGQYSRHRKQRQGNSAACIKASELVVCSQNHDQVGNRMLGERSAALLDFEALKLSAAAVLLSPFLPLLFMGEEFAEQHPFLYFTSHGDPGLSEAVRDGRRREFAAFAWQGEPADPQSEATFLSSKVHALRDLDSKQRQLRDFYRELIRLRKSVPALREPGKELVETMSSEELKLMVVKRGAAGREIYAMFNFNPRPVPFPATLARGHWKCLLDSAGPRWFGPGSSIPKIVESTKTALLTLAPQSACLFSRERL